MFDLGCYCCHSVPDCASWWSSFLFWDICDHVHVFNVCHCIYWLLLFLTLIEPSITGVTRFRRAIIIVIIIIELKMVTYATPPMEDLGTHKNMLFLFN